MVQAELRKLRHHHLDILTSFAMRATGLRRWSRFRGDDAVGRELSVEMIGERCVFEEGADIHEAVDAIAREELSGFAIFRRYIFRRRPSLREREFH